MKIAITVWGNRISPVFDSARTLLLIEVQGNEIISRQMEQMRCCILGKVSDILEKLSIDVLICGAMTKDTATLFESGQIEIIPFIAGNTEKVLTFYIEGKNLTDFIMPGCLRRQYGRGRRCGRNRQTENCCHSDSEIKSTEKRQEV